MIRNRGSVSLNHIVFKEFFEKTEYPVVISSLEGKYLYVNESYLKLREKKMNDLVGRYWWETFSNREQKKFAQDHFDIVLRNRSYSYRVEYRQKNGEQVVMQWTAQVIKIPGEKSELVTEIGADVTGEMLLKSQLTHVQKIESLGTLAGGIAHEFNNILTSIIGYTSFLKSLLKEKSKERKYIAKIQKSALGAAGLTSKLLRFARKEKCNEKLVNVNLIIREVTDILSTTTSKKVRMPVHLSDRMYHVLADYDEIYQSVMNLIINARDAIEDRGEIVVTTAVEDFKKDTAIENFVIKKGKYVTVTVKDSGKGMSPDIKKKVFEPFFTTKAVGEGTGLGLSMVYSMMKSHKGFITIDSSPGKGTSIKLLLPALSVIKTLSDSEDSGIYSIAAYSRKGNILIVEEEAEIIEYLQSVLIEYGYRVFKSGSSQEAIEIMTDEENQLHLMILDISMPFVEGKHLIKTFLEINRDLQIIVITGYSSDDMINSIRELGVHYFLFKPFKVSNLMQIVTRIMEDRESPDIDNNRG